MSDNSVPSQAGTVYMAEDDGKLTGLSWNKNILDNNEKKEVSHKTVKEIKDYFAGRLQHFKTPLAPEGTPFQQKIWQRLQKIPYGETVTYGDIAKELGTSPRAVGRAVGSNPIPILIPCHRVLGANGAMTGFSGGEGIETKKILLNLEQKHKGA